MADESISVGAAVVVLYVWMAFLSVIGLAWKADLKTPDSYPLVGALFWPLLVPKLVWYVVRKVTDWRTYRGWYVLVRDSLNWLWNL